MKKALLFLVFVALLTALAVSASAASTPHPHNGDHCVCGGSAVGVQDHSCSNISWSAVPTSTKDLNALKSGNYYLTQDLTISAATTINNKQIKLCLNGYSISTTTTATFGYLSKASTLTICDCSGKQTDGVWSWGGTISGSRSGNARQYGGITKVNANSSLTVYGGNFIGSTGGEINTGGIFTVCNDRYADVGGTSVNDPTLNTWLRIYNGSFIGGDVSAKGAIIGTWHNVYIGIYGGTFTGGTGGSDGSLSFSKTTTATITNATITGSSPANVWVMEGDRLISQHKTLSAAAFAAKPGQKLRLTGDLREDVTLTGGILIDLAGNDLSGVTIENASFMDSTTDRYTANLCGTLTPASGTPALQCKDQWTAKRYMALKEGNSYTFHRYYMAITKLTLRPNTAGMGYKATFIADERLKSTVTGYGFSMWLNENKKLQKTMDAGSFGGTKELSLRLDHFMKADLAAEENIIRADTPVYASAYLTLSDGTSVESTAVYYTLHDVTELVNDQFENYTSTQQAAIRRFGKTFGSTMRYWDVDQFHHENTDVWKTVNATEFNNMLVKTSYGSGSTVYSIPSGSYVLTEDVNTGKKGLIILEGKHVDLCLNGHTISGATRMFRNYGTLNICDCHDGAEEGMLTSSLTVTTSKNYASVVYCYYNSITNLYGGTMQSTGTLSAGGVVGISHDGDENNPNHVPAVFNMYGGTIIGGTVTGNGGNVAMWNGGCMNMYGGTICNGSAAGGGGIHASSGTLAIYGGTIRDNDALSGNGGNVLISASGTLKLCGGTITGGTATAVTVDGVPQPDTGLGGGVYINRNTLQLEGDVQIYDNTVSDLYIGHMVTLDTKNLAPTASIGISADICGMLSADSSHVDRFISNRSDYKIEAINGTTALLPAATNTQAVTASQTAFRVGYSITDITPTEIGLTMSSYGNPNGRKTDGTVNFPLNATAIAITDRENTTVLMITVDLQNPATDYIDTITQRISRVTGVPAGNIYISATHTHNAPTPSTSTDPNRRYLNLLIDALIRGSLAAMEDRAPATMSTGSFDTQGMNYTRHYYYYDSNGEKVYFGDQFGTQPSGVKFYRVRQGDTTMHMLSFDREGKQPILLVNWRAHPHRSGGMTKVTLDADVIGATRAYIHNNTDYLFAYYQGAAGNVNTSSRISGETYKSGKIKEYGDELGRQITVGMANLTAVPTGLINTKKIIYAASVDHSQDHMYEQAMALQNHYKTYPDEMDTYAEQVAVAATYGFTSYFHATRLISKYKLGETKDLELNIFSIGESVGFYTAPAELWDSFSEEMEQLSPFDTTLCIGYCNGGVAYIPYKLDYENSYEDLYCLFTQPETITQMMAYYLEALKEQFGISKEDAVIAQRRDTAEEYMRQMCSVLWRSDETFTYIKSGTETITIQEGRIYQGLPYTYGGNNVEAFLDYSTGENNGIYEISGMSSQLQNASSSLCRMGSDCSSTVLTSWNTISDSFTATASRNMVVNRGCLRVGDYQSDPSTNTDTKNTVAANGQQVMFEAYAKLQKADGLVQNNGANVGHAIMVVSVNVVRNGKEIDPTASTVTILEQTSYYVQREDYYYDEELGENVYIISNIDKVHTFQSLYNSGYLPITCLELISPEAVDAPAVTDSEISHTTDTLYTGTFTSNRLISSVTVTITDEKGQTVQSLTGYGLRSSWRVFSLSRLQSDAPDRTLGNLDLSALSPGTYTCTYTCRLSEGTVIQVREFEFTV